MTPADRLLEHFDRLAGTEPRFARISDEGVEPLIDVATYFNFPTAGALTAFTLGLSHSHPPDGSHKELMISMLGTDETWAQACGTLALRLYGRCPFNCGDTINFRERIALSSEMSAFVAVHPLLLWATDQVVDIGVRRVELMQLVPIYEQEREWLSAGGDLERFLAAYDSSELMNPNRKRYEPPPKAVPPGTQGELKTIEYRGGVVEFRIPSDWVEEYEPDGGGTFYDRAIDAATLRLHVMTLKSPEPVDESTAVNTIRDAAAIEEREVVALDNGNALASYRRAAVEDGQEIAIYRWEVAHAAPPMFVHMALFSLTVLQSREDDAEVADVIKMVAREAALCCITDIAPVSSLRVQLPKRQESVLLAAMEARGQGSELGQLACTSLEAPSAVAVVRELLGDDLTVMFGAVPQPDPRVPRRAVPFVLWSYKGSDNRLTTDAQPSLAAPPKGVGTALGRIACCDYSLKSWSQRAFDAARRLDGLTEPEVLAAMLYPPTPMGFAAAEWRFRIQVVAALVISHMTTSTDRDSHAQPTLSAILDGPVDWATTAAIIALLDVARRDEAARTNIVQRLEEVSNWEVTAIAYSCAIEPAMLAILDIPGVPAETRSRVFDRLCESLEFHHGNRELPGDDLVEPPCDGPASDWQVQVQAFTEQADLSSFQSIVMAPTLEQPIGLGERSNNGTNRRLPGSGVIARTLILTIFLVYVGSLLFGEMREFEQYGERFSMNSLLKMFYFVLGTWGTIACYTFFALIAIVMSLIDWHREQ